MSWNFLLRTVLVLKICDLAGSFSTSFSRTPVGLKCK